MHGAAEAFVGWAARAAAIAFVALTSGTASPAPVAAQIAPAVPVLLVPGWSDDADDLGPLRVRFVEAGWRPEAVLSVNFTDPMGSNDDGSREVARAVEELMLRTGASEVDIVAHSMGGLAVRWYLRSAAGSDAARRVVFLATPHRGTLAASMAWGEGGHEMFPGSDFLERLNAPARSEADVEMLSIRTTVDLRIIPGSSAMLPGAYNVEVCCPSHQGLIDDAETFREIHAFLLHGTRGLTLPDASIPMGIVPDRAEAEGQGP